MSPKQQIWHSEQQRKKRFLIIALLLLVLVLIPLCVVATYTWFGTSKTPKVSDMEMTINSSYGLQLAWSADAKEEDWQQQLNYTDVVDVDAILTPVTWSNEQERFYTALMGTDGRVIDIGVELSDEKDTNSRDGHYIKFTVYGRTEQNVSVSLKEGLNTADGKNLTGTYLIGTPLWQNDEKIHTDGGLGAQYATRVGFKITKLDIYGNEKDDSNFFIYEPNADAHINGSSGVLNTPSLDGGEELVPPSQLIRQSAFNWKEQKPVQRGVLAWSTGKFEEEKELFELSSDEKVKIDVYIWLEGKDIDCVNALGSGAQLTANIQFEASADSGSGLVPIQ